MTTFQQKARKQLLSEERRGLLARYIQEKNQQVERAFLQEQELADNTLFAPRKISTTKVSLDFISPTAKISNKAYVSGEPCAKVLDSHELIQQIAEIAQFSADIKIQQEKHSEEVIKLQASIKKNTTEVRAVEDALSDNETSQRIRYSMFLEHLKEITGNMEMLETKIQILNESATLMLERVEKLELREVTRSIPASANIASTICDAHSGAEACSPMDSANASSPAIVQAMDLLPVMAMTDAEIIGTQRSELGIEIPGIVITSPSDCSAEMYDLAMEIYSRNVDDQPLVEVQEEIEKNYDTSE